MQCCEAWELVWKCFHEHSFECIDFHGLIQIIASFTRERPSEREAEISHLHWTQREKDSALAMSRLGLRAWRSKKPMLFLHAVTENEDESGRSAKYGARFSKHAPQARGTIAMRLSCDTSRKHLTTFALKLTRTSLMSSWPQKKESAPGPAGIPHSLYRCAEGL